MSRPSSASPKPKPAPKDDASRSPSPASCSTSDDVKDEPVDGIIVFTREDVADELAAKKEEEGEPLSGKRERDSSTPGASSSRRTQQQQQQRAGPQLIGDLPVATAAAMDTFEELAQNHYQYGTLGRSREALEGMNCDCQYEHGWFGFYCAVLPYRSVVDAGWKDITQRLTPWLT
jgi:hypothetical protein